MARMQLHSAGMQAAGMQAQLDILMLASHLLGLAAGNGAEAHGKAEAILDAEEERWADPRKPFAMPPYEQGLETDAEVACSAFKNSRRCTAHQTSRAAERAFRQRSSHNICIRVVLVDVQPGICRVRKDTCVRRYY